MSGPGGAPTSDAKSALQTGSGARWRAMVRAHQEQSQRLREPAWQAGRDYAPPSVDSFRVDRERADEARVLEVQRSLTQPEDIGAGAGPDHNSNEENCSCNTAISARPD